MGIHQQFRAAWLLAREYGHQWGSTLDRYKIEEIISKTAKADATTEENATAVAAAIREAVRATEGFDWEWEGISAPQAEDRNGSLEHETGTRRTFWSISPEGEVLILIDRMGPEGPVQCLRAEVSPYEVTTTSAGRTAGIEVRAPFARRHLLALNKALTALLGRDGAFRACAPLWAGAEMDPWEVDQGEEGLAPALGGDRNV